MFVEREELARYRGMNPDFVRQVWERRRAERVDDRAERAAAKAAERARQRADALRRAAELRDAGARERAERLAAIQARQQMLGKDIAAAVAAAHGYLLSEIASASRSRHLCKVRDIAIRAVADARPDLSNRQIGIVFGGRDHTTIMHSLSKTRQPGQAR